MSWRSIKVWLESCWFGFNSGNFFDRTKLFLSALALCVALIGVLKINDMNEKLFISDLGDRCGWMRSDGGDYESYKILEEMGRASWDPFIKGMVKAELQKVKASYLSSDTLVVLIPIYRNENGQLIAENENNPHWDNIIAQKNHTFWQTRSRVAYFLRFATNGVFYSGKEILSTREVLEELIDYMNNDPSFIVRKTALDSFRILTKFEPNNVNNVFHFEEATAWFRKK